MDSARRGGAPRGTKASMDQDRLTYSLGRWQRDILNKKWANNAKMDGVKVFTKALRDLGVDNAISRAGPQSALDYLYVGDILMELKTGVSTKHGLEDLYQGDNLRAKHRKAMGG